jgi:hypothetical protein
MQAMTPRLWVFSLAPVLAVSSAYAQAPGEVASAPPPPPSYAPAPAGPCGGSAAPVMARRWAIGLSIGRLGVAPDGAVEGSEARFSVAELAVRYRATRRLELELGMSGGREVLADGNDGDLAAGSVTLAVRYRFRPEQRWNWFVMGGFGGTVIAPHASSEAERDGATRPLGMAGLGLERRFRRLALQAELRMVGLGPREDAVEGVPVADGGGAPTKPTMPGALLPASAATTYADELGGGMFTLGASFYF